MNVSPLYRDQTSRPVVAVYRTQILPLSETFVRDQALALRRWRAFLVGEREISALPLLGLKVASMYEGAPKKWQRALGMIRRELDWVPGKLTELVQMQGANLIHAHFGFDGVEAWPIAQKLDIPLLVTLHGADITTHMNWFREGKAGRRWRSYPSRLERLAKARRVSFVAISENIRAAAIDAGLPSDRIFVNRIGIEPGNFVITGAPIAARPPIILFLGRLVEKKGVAYLLEAFQIIRQRVPEAELVIAGDGPERTKLSERAKTIGNVRFVGAYSGEQARDLLTKARVLCLPSITAESGDAEGLPLVTLEAQASGVPVVTSARGGATEGIQDGLTGFSFAERDVAGMVKHLMMLLTDSALAERFSLAAPKFVNQCHNLHICTEGLETLYDSLVRNQS